MTDVYQPSLECPVSAPPPGAQGLLRVAVKDNDKQLLVTFARPVSPALLEPHNYRLTGGQRRFPHVISVSRNERVTNQLTLQLDQLGDFSVYTLSVNAPDIDPFCASHQFRFRLACDNPFDCRPEPDSALPEAEEQIAIDYLAKDYASFRQALLDFLAWRRPDWTERSEADLGMMLLELFAATADTLSYVQDRIANEAFLETATQRRSVAGHLALLGYELDEGAAAQTWLAFRVKVNHTLPDTSAGASGWRVCTQPRRADEPVIVFETHGAITLRPEHNQLKLFNWGRQNCRLPRGARQAELADACPHLRMGDYLLLDDGAGAREVVRLNAAPEIIKGENAYTIIRWLTPLQHDYELAKTIVRGNLVLATHGETVAEKPKRKAGRRWRLTRGPLAHLDTATSELIEPQQQTAPANLLTRQPRSRSTLRLKIAGELWQQQPTLLGSRSDDPFFRVEINDAGEATIVLNQSLAAAADISATYRIGGGEIGNVAADTLIVPGANNAEPLDWLESVSNPLPATGGRTLESREHARRVAPQTFQKPLVAVTAADYQAAAQEFIWAGRPAIQRAKARFHWTGSWLTVTLAVDPADGAELTPELRTALLNYLETRRLAGYDLRLVQAVYAPIELTLEFCAADGWATAEVQRAIQQRLSGGLHDKGFFHPDQFTFGERLEVSRIYAAVAAVPGVESVTIKRLARLHAAAPERETEDNLAQGYLAVGAEEIIQLDNDRNFPGRGVLTVRPKGARR